MHTLLTLLATWHRRSRIRRGLAMLDRRSLRDVGIDPGLVDYEIAQPFWRPSVILRESAQALAVPGVANDHLPLSASPNRAVATSRT